MSASIAPSALAELVGAGWRRRRASAAALAEALRALVVDGRLAVRTRLPSERALAPALGVGRGTVTRAYDLLRDDGYLRSARGAGSWLTLPGDPGQHPSPLGGEARTLDLSIAALPAPPMLADVAAEAAVALRGHLSGLGYAHAGLPALREAVAARFGARGLPTTPDQVLITAGAQHALHLLLAVLASPGDRVLVDAPAYPRTLSAIRGARARAVAVPLRPDGWDADAWTQALTAASPRLAVTAPDFHNPTGLTMGPRERRAIPLACARAGVPLVVDETISELWLDGPPPAPLAIADPAAVITIGSMSKAAWGGLRLGWIRTAPQLARELRAARADVDMASPLLEQLVAVGLLERWDAVLDSRRGLLRERRQALLAALERHAPAWETRRPEGGLATWVGLPTPVATRLAAAAAREGIAITPGPAFSPDGAFERRLRLPFTAPPADLDAAVARLAALAGRVGAYDSEPLAMAPAV